MGPGGVAGVLDVSLENIPVSAVVGNDRGGFFKRVIISSYCNLNSPDYAAVCGNPGGLVRTHVRCSKEIRIDYGFKVLEQKDFSALYLPVRIFC